MSVFGRLCCRELKSENKKIIELRGISKEYDGEKVLRDLNLEIHDNEFITLLGPSGCGKTTTLKIIGGFERPDKGEVIFNDRVINDLPANKRPVNTVFQNYALFPHLNVFENVAFGLRVAKVGREEIKQRVGAMLHSVALDGFDHRNVNQLSGGQQQRVAIARALINEPQVLLLDEPLGALDFKLRKDMQTELKRIQTSLKKTFVFVTHDQEEALAMSDTVVVMNEGKIQQIGSPTDIYNEPENAFVADFIGESNILDGRMIRDRLVYFFGRAFECLDGGFATDEPVDVVVRPEDIVVLPPSENLLCGKVTQITFKGIFYEIIADVRGFKWMIQSTKAPAVGDTIGLEISPDGIHVMKKSEYSGVFGDYSSFSEEYEHLDEIDEDREGKES